MSYQIHDIELLTGIKAHTIRIWEKRYNLIEPLRTATNIRYYDDNQIRQLLNVSTLISAGWKISKIAALSEEDVAAEIRALQLADSVELSQSSYTAGLTSAMIAFDEEEFEALMDEVIVKFGTLDAMIKVVYPFLIKVGMLWSTNEVMPAQEHFATCIIRRRLITDTAALPAPYKTDKKFLLFLPEQEWHEIGLLLSAYLVRRAGYHHVYLGQSVPFENVHLTQQAIQATHLVSFYLSEKKKINLVQEFEILADTLRNVTLIMCGRAEMIQTIANKQNIVKCDSVLSITSQF
jgi:DNA-binding transcriptional MerR regulator